eukprot:CAMPEP_0194559350 /NCGR_PEP_ID=MMETSP0292-20121207/929_1 /TAXON_ID=39354 /ORGANISM="Heterosigma akashiwo, Strain CCMP2393" /LENGTH=283 /DNA_ID=CAMNT_0039407239 /DNA_START=401 /DNA_END=1249 /DNA_ORIENTATION=-
MTDENTHSSSSQNDSNAYAVSLLYIKSVTLEAGRMQALPLIEVLENPSLNEEEVPQSQSTPPEKSEKQEVQLMNKEKKGLQREVGGIVAPDPESREQENQPPSEEESSKSEGLCKNLCLGQEESTSQVAIKNPSCASWSSSLIVNIGPLDRTLKSQLEENRALANTARATKSRRLQLQKSLKTLNHQLLEFHKEHQAQTRRLRKAVRAELVAPRAQGRAVAAARDLLLALAFLLAVGALALAGAWRARHDAWAPISPSEVLAPLVAVLPRGWGSGGGGGGADL